MEAKVNLKSIENLKTSTGLKDEKEGGEVVDRHLVTKVQFECEAAPADLATIHRLLAADVSVSVVIGSPQLVMDLFEKEGAFAGK